MPLDERAPLVRFWRHQGDDLIEQPNDFTLDFDNFQTPEAANDDHRLKRCQLVVELTEELSLLDVDVGNALYGNSNEGRDAPMRTVMLLHESQLGDGLAFRFTSYRTLTTVELVRGVPRG